MSCQNLHFVLWKSHHSRQNSPELPQWTWPAHGRLPAGAAVPCAEKRVKDILAKAIITWHWGSPPRPAWLVGRLGLRLRFDLRLVRGPPWRWPLPSKHYHLSFTWGESSQMPFFRWKHSGWCIKLSGALCQATVRCELTSGSLHRQL